MKVFLKGNAFNTQGSLPPAGSQAPDFNLTKTDLSDVSLKDFAGKRVVMNIFPSIDTPVCATSTRRFNQEAGNLKNTVVLCVSMDLPFAHKRFCGAEGLEKVVSVSELRGRKFGEDYGVKIIDGPMAGLFARAVVIIDEKGQVIYTELVPDIVQEPDYKSAINILS